MKSTTINRLLQATAFSYLGGLALAQSATSSAGTPTSTAAGAIETLKCYSNAGNLTENDTSTFQTDGLCQSTCAALALPVMAITGGSTCYCGEMIPPLDAQVASSNCDSPCGGYDQKTCGGIGYWQVYLTGLTGDVQTSPNATSSSSSSSSTSSSATHQASTVVVTAAASSDANSGGGGPNKVGIAVGVVVGVVALAGLIGGLIFYMKQRRRKEIEEEHKAAAAANAVRSDKSSATDSRLDPSAFSDFSRRESIGSIADERDFSRRILQVSNSEVL